MSVLVLAALGLVGGGLLIAVAVLVPGRLLSRPEPDPRPALDIHDGDAEGDVRDGGEAGS